MLWREILLAFGFLTVVGGLVLIYAFHQQVGQEIETLLQGIDRSSSLTVGPIDDEDVPGPVRR